MSAAPGRKILLSIIELGGYPSFTTLYEQAGYEVVTAVSVRKALSLLKQTRPDVVVCEFNYQSDFRDRTSSLESLLAVMQTIPGTKVIVFYEREFAHQLEKLTSRFPIFAALAYPISEEKLVDCVRQAAAVV